VSLQLAAAVHLALKISKSFARPEHNAALCVLCCRSVFHHVVETVIDLPFVVMVSDPR
jgi:hypothetical protein